MHFKTLELQGFKSFPDKTILSFDTRTTAVVGSNGNGKSNISDALRWVMGEQGARTLRSDKAVDIIFHGTEKRKAMSFAKVSLTVDNVDRGLPIDKDEVVITRKLYKTGESEYLINGEKSRLKDIGSLFMGTGLGRDGYSIIGQGRIEEIVNSKPEQRREVFEEAAGVSKFLHKKAATERELSRTDENLLRLLDIESELKARIPVLERQSEKAKKAFALKESERDLSVALSVYELDEISKDIDELSNTILLNQGECEHFEREILELEGEGETLFDERRILTAEIETTRAKNESTNDLIKAIETKVAVTENDIIHNNSRVDELKNEITLTGTGKTEILEKIKGIKNEVNVKEGEVISIEKRIEETTEEIQKLEEENTLLDKEQRELEGEIRRLFNEKSSLEIHMSHSSDTISDLSVRLDDAKKRAENSNEERLSLTNQKIQLEKDINELFIDKEESQNKLSGYLKFYETKSESLEKTRDELELLKTEINQKKTRFNILSDVERSMAGYYSSVKAIMTAAKSGRFGNNCVEGTVADVVEVDSKYSVAVEVALGAALQNIIVSNEAVAKRCMAFLKETRSGRATFLPLTSIKGNALNLPELYNEDGFLGMGSDVITYDKRFSEIVKMLLGRVAFTDDIDTATRLGKKYGYRFKIVTLDGQVVNAGGSFTGGSVKKSENILGRKHEISELRTRLDLIEGELLPPLKERYNTLAGECARLKLQCEGCRETLSNLSGEEIRLSSETKRVDDILSRFDEQLLEQNKTISICENGIKTERENLLKNEALIKVIVKKLSESEVKAREKGETFSKMLDIRRSVSDNASKLGLEKLSAFKDIENLNAQIKNLELSFAEVDDTKLKLEGEINAFLEKNKGLELEIQSLKGEIEEITLNYKNDRERIGALVSRAGELEKRAGEVQSLIREKTEDKGKFMAAYTVATERKSDLKKKEDEIKSRLFDNFELTPTEAVTLSKTLEPIDDKAKARDAKIKLGELKKSLSALGSINYAAIDEHTEVLERYRQLSSQLDDIRKAKAELEGLISELTDDIRTRFLESFNDISYHFSRIFGDIFKGGKAKLELTNPDDVLSTGIEIYAAPPGKLVKNLISLSGGEKSLVAITLYFAILMHRPTPFCMLDEVDAALDEVNVAKYINYLSRFSDTTQLMIITHRRPTIEGCDVLYGVFMQEKGVSRLLKQEISDK